MATQRLLVSVANIIANSEIEENAEPSKVRTAALSAQRVEVRSVLGAALMDLFEAAIDDTGALTGLTAIQTTFHSDYLSPLLAAHAAAKYVYVSHYNISGTGVKTIKGKNDEPATDKAVELTYKRLKADADFYGSRAKEFICLTANYADLGIYYHGANQNLPPSPNTPKGSIYFGE